MWEGSFFDLMFFWICTENLDKIVILLRENITGSELCGDVALNESLNGSFGFCWTMRTKLRKRKNSEIRFQECKVSEVGCMVDNGIF